MGRTQRVTAHRPQLRPLIETIMVEHPTTRRHESPLTSVYLRLQVDRRRTGK